MSEMIGIIRLKNNEELIAVIEGKFEGKLKISHPYYIKFNSSSNMLGMLPYCPLSDEKYFELDLLNVEFVVSVKKIVKNKYFDMLKDDYDLNESKVSFESDINYDQVMFIEGNQTKH